MSAYQLRQRVEERIRDWNIVVQSTLDTPSSFIAYGTQGDQPVVLKVIRLPGDEWLCGRVLRAFDGNGTVRVYEHTEGAVLLERLNPGTSLASLALDGRDEEATAIISEVIQQMAPASESLSGRASSQRALKTFVTVEEWGDGFQRYRTSGDKQVPQHLVEQGHTLYGDLCASQKHTRLLHGDLQHYNILCDAKRGWTAIDPKGVIGEIEYEIGASLRNPYEAPELFSSPDTIRQRLKAYEAELKLDYERMLKWGFAQAVLSAIWTIEDGGKVDNRNSAIMLATAMSPMLA
jgi:streptomycin 6-kinase